MRLLPILPNILLALLASRTASSSAGTETFDETVRIQSLPDGKVHSSFEFIMKGPWNGEGTHPSTNTVGTSQYPLRGIAQTSLGADLFGPPDSNPSFRPPSLVDVSLIPLPHHILLSYTLFRTLEPNLASDDHTVVSYPFDASFRHRTSSLGGITRGREGRGRAGEMGSIPRCFGGIILYGDH